ncbi:hypothetical protein FRX31_023138 [Thalictrum thalictroides]|uniref:Uncharacterized protein n=1 Tax=Thalictrum thalictroides TaxID=46969 RepID=A0A7J6VSS0_THATH|nr:hypothetical protein FRX31_023138 [Thalictrum thalictroides]
MTLQLENVELPHRKSNGHSSLKQPSFENLVLINCQQNRLKVFDISCIRLKNLAIDNRHRSIGHCKIKISTPNLISFKCKGGMYEDYILVNLSSLASVEFGFNANRHNSQGLTNALRGFCNATSLQLSPVWFEPTFETREMLNLFGPFCNLKYLNMTSDSSGCIRALAIFLTNSPQLKRVILDIFEANDEDWNEDLPFNDKHNNLKAIEVQNCKCSEDLTSFFANHNTVLPPLTNIRGS